MSKDYMPPKRETWEARDGRLYGHPLTATTIGGRAIREDSEVTVVESMAAYKDQSPLVGKVSRTTGTTGWMD